MKYFANVEDPSRCGVRLYKKYMSLRQPNAPHNISFLKPAPCPCNSGGYWYSAQLMGHNVLRDTVKRLCSGIGLDGHYTNHSLR